jgi:hypothetical protein
MRIKLPTQWKDKLGNLPETSMGAQHVDITLRNGRIIRDVPVFNGEECESKETFDVMEISDIKLHEK